MSEDRDDIDWSLTAWEGSRRAQLRRVFALTLRERMGVVEGMAEVARRFEEIRRAGGFRKAAGEVQGGRAAAARFRGTERMMEVPA